MTGTSALPDIYCDQARSRIQMDDWFSSLSWLTAQAVQLRLNDGGRPKFCTSVRAIRDDEDLVVGFACDDPDPIGQMTKRDDPLFDDGNVVEMFVDPAGDGKSFYEFEVNPLNTLLDLFFERRGIPWREAAQWDAEGIRTSVIVVRDEVADRPCGWCVQIAVPWSNFRTAARTPPRNGDVWRINFFRYNTLKVLFDDVVELSSWSPTFEKRFDVPERFGFIHF